MATIDDVKILLMGAGENQDALLNLIIGNTEASLKLRIGAKSVPDELNHVVVEVAIKRFNRLKNEGMSSYGQEGETITFSTDDFNDFADDIDAWLDANATPKTLGTLRFVNPYGGGSQ
jgi:hypothetical protein